MKARQLIDGVTLGPSALKVIGEAFDQAWTEVEHGFDSHQVEAARVCLAKGILANATDSSRSVDELRRHGLRALMFHYPQAMVKAVTQKKA